MKVQFNLPELFNDQFGNYVIQKYFENCDKIFITKILEKIKGSLFIISINTHGTRAFQRMLDFINSDQDFDILKDFFQKNLFNLIKDNSGNHVVQKLFYVFPKNKNQFIFEELAKHIFEVSKLKQGGCIIQKAFDTSNIDQKALLVNEIIKYMDKMINDEFGNFIIQHVLNLKNDEFSIKVINYVKENIVELSKLKFSSNVIDKCLLYDNVKLKNEIIEKLVSKKIISELILDQYGNYVVQKALSATSGNLFNELISLIKPALKNMKNSHNGKKIFDSIMHNYGEYFHNPNQNINNKNVNVISKKSNKG